MLRNKKNITIVILFMILIIVLAVIPTGKLKIKLKHNFIQLSLIRARVQRVVDFELSFSMVQNFLHIPFFALLSFLWMKFFNKRRIEFKKSILYTLLITLFFSIFEEACQISIIDRNASLLDLFLNFSGSLIGVGAFTLFGQSRMEFKG